MEKSKRAQWRVCGLLFFATVINYVDRQTLSVLTPELRQRFHLSNTDYSHILTAFMLAYMIMQSGWGRILDKLGSRAGMALSMVVWSGAAVLHAAANSALTFAGCRFLLGLGEAGNWPGGVKVVSEWFAPEERAFAIGVFNSGSTLGAVLTPPVVAWIALRWGWQQAFVATGVLGFLWLALWMATYRAPAVPRQKAFGSNNTRWLDLLQYREVWALILSRLLADPVWWFYVFWLPDYLRQARHFSLAEIGYFAWIPFLTASAGNVLGGWLSGWMVARGTPVLRARKTVMAASAIVMMAGIPAVGAGAAGAALAWISVATLAYSVWAANILTLPADVFPQRVVGSVAGMAGTGAALGGMISSLMIGRLVDRFSYWPPFLLAGLMPLLAAAVVIAGYGIPRKRVA